MWYYYAVLELGSKYEMGDNFSHNPNINVNKIYSKGLTSDGRMMTDRERMWRPKTTILGVFRNHHRIFYLFCLFLYVCFKMFDFSVLKYFLITFLLLI